MNIVLPSLGDIDEVEVTEICVALGDTVGAETPVIVIESDKASMEVPAGAAGTIAELQVSIGDRLGEGAVIGRLDAPVGQAQTAESEAATEPADKQAPAATSSAPSTKPAASSAGLQTVQILVPDLGDIDQVEVIEVAAQAGNRVAPGDLLVVLESDKASMEIPAEITGELLQMKVVVGDQVGAGSVLALAKVTQETGQIQVDRAEIASQAPSPASSAVTAPQVPATPSSEQAPIAQQHTGDTAGSSVYAGPATRRLAREIGVPLSQVTGSGNRGRITKDDVKAWAKARMNQASSQQTSAGSGIPALPTVDFAKFGDVEEVALSRIQKQVAANMQRSWLNIPHVTQHTLADIEDLEAFRQSLREEAQARAVKLSPLPFIIKAVCHSLAAHPKLNGSVSADGEHLIFKHFVNIGIAVDTPDGLVVPVIRGADQMGIWALAQQAQQLAEKARSKKLALDDLSGGTFTISSLGAIGGTGFTPIINAPEVAILGVGKSAIQPVWQGEQFVPRLQLPLSLSYDHRVINGTDGGHFSATLGQLLGDMRRLML
ncbi:MAG: dihydrolipoamide acetyltransferase [Proteobacteria bacterium]|nr:dihydrolipoamide acetyltransferase [Pseudomonadota bacterium]